MSDIKKSALELIGKTPLLLVENYQRNADATEAEILVKLEYFNPAGSVKDRVALQMIQDLEESGRIKPGATLIEPTSGNTGIGIAAVAAAKGYKVVITIPETMSVERRNIIKAYGAEIVLTEGSKGMKGAIAKAEEIKNETPGAVILGQFINSSNPKVHKLTTGPEIWEDTDGETAQCFRKEEQERIRFRESAQDLFRMYLIQKFMMKLYQLRMKTLLKQEKQLQKQKVFWLEFHQEQHCLQQQNWQRDRKTKERKLLHCFLIQETDTTARLSFSRLFMEIG